MRKNKLFWPGIGLGLLVIVMIFLIINFKSTSEFEIDPNNISVFEENHSEYYLKKAPKDLGFEVFLDDSTEELEYKLIDESGNEVDAQSKKKKDHTYEIMAPKLGYEKGKRYRLELGQGAFFSSEELLNAESLVFLIEKDPIEHYKFTDQVVELDQEILQVSADIVEVKNSDLQEDDIIFGLNEDEEYIAYKISEVINEDNAKVTIPAIDEIYSELEVYGEYKFDFNDIVSNPDIETKVINNIKSSSFFSSLLTEAYGKDGDNDDVDIYLEYNKHPVKDSLEIKVVITLQAGEKGLFAKKELKNHELKLTLVSEFGTKADLDIDSVKNWDVSASRSESFSWEVDITYKPPKIDQSSKFSDLFLEDNEEEVMEITKLLNEMVSDEMKNDIKLFEHGIPVPGVPGLILSLDINVALTLELQANLNLQNGYSTNTTVGLMYRDSNFKSYSNINSDGGNGEASIKGELNSKSGLSFELKTTLLHEKIAYMSLKPEVGLYADAYIAITMNNLKLDNDRSYGYFESGTYFNAVVQGHINTLFKKHDFNSEIDEVRNKFDTLSFGDYKITTGLETEKLTVFSKDSLASPPSFTFNYYDIRSGEEVSQTLKPSEVNYFLEDRKEVKLKDNHLIIPETDEEELVLRAEYKDDNNRFYSKDLKLYISENRKAGIIDHDNFEDSMQLMFSSGAGAWSTEINLASDGSFTGKYLDSNAGQSGDGHLATNYFSEFTGWFGDIQRLDEETYSMKLLDINYEHEEYEEWIENDVKYIAAEAYGLEKGEDFFLYSPKKPIQDLNEDLLSWGSAHGIYSDPPNEELLYWVLHNEETNYGFYSEQYLDNPEKESDETVTGQIETLPTSFEHIEFDNDYSGPGSEFIGTWGEVNDTTVHFAPNPWEVNYKDGTFYITANLPGDPGLIIMTAKYRDNKLYSNNGTQIELLDYQNPDTLEIDLPDTIETDGEISQIFFEDGYLQWFSEVRGDMRDSTRTETGNDFKGYEKE